MHRARGTEQLKKTTKQQRMGNWLGLIGLELKLRFVSIVRFTVSPFLFIDLSRSCLSCLI